MAPSRASLLESIEQRVLWLSTAMVDHANNVRVDESGLKVGGHRASSALITSIMTALWFEHLRPEDRVSVKPHASPVLHAVNYLLGQLDARHLTTLREFGGLQSYPSRSKVPLMFPGRRMLLPQPRSPFSWEPDALICARAQSPIRNDSAFWHSEQFSIPAAGNFTWKSLAQVNELRPHSVTLVPIRFAWASDAGQRTSSPPTRLVDVNRQTTYQSLVTASSRPVRASRWRRRHPRCSALCRVATGPAFG